MRFVKIFLFASLLLTLPASYRHVTKGVRLDKLLVATDRENSFFTEEVKGILNQEFEYLAQGTQSYVFQSRDRQYVLKLFRFEQTQNFIYQAIRTKIKKKPLRLNYEKQKERLFSACLIAFESAQEETALVALHLGKTQSQEPPLRLIGPLGQKWTLDLNDYCFAIQKKGEPIFSSLSATLKTGDVDLMKRKLDSFRSLLKSRAGKGIVNLDSNLHRNFGFIGEKAIEIDFGAYQFTSAEDAKKDVQFFSERFHLWLKKRMKPWVSYWEVITSSERESF